MKFSLVPVTDLRAAFDFEAASVEEMKAWEEQASLI